ncbi:MAG: hypothetical protein E7337_14910 [Clostridiales bacterium]|nr:hypothetical protein [Clostridiales bacterium]
MKKLLALILALMMMLTCISAFADTIYTKVAVDPEVAKELMTGFGVPEDQMAMVDPILALVNALGVNVITVTDGAQIDLDLNGADALSLGFATDDAGINVVSTLFPNYVVTISQETIGQIMEQFMANMPIAGGEGGMDMNAFMGTFSGYITPWVEACSAAGKPGDPVTGEYEFEGYKFDTMVPVTVDMAAITEATQKLLDDLLADPAAMAAIKGMAQGMAQSTGETIDDEKFTEDFKAGFEEFMAHFPATASAEVYANSDGSETFYMNAEAMREGETEPFTAYMLYVDAQNMKMGYQDGQTTEAGFEMTGSDMTMYFAMGEMYFGLAMSFAENQFGMDIYFMNEEKPLVSITVDMAAGGERTLSVDTAGKTAVALALPMDGNDESVQGLLGDIMMNGLGGLMGTLSEQVPEIASMLGGDAAMAG